MMIQWFVLDSLTDEHRLLAQSGSLISIIHHILIVGVGGRRFSLLDRRWRGRLVYRCVGWRRGRGVRARVWRRKIVVEVYLHVFVDKAKTRVAISWQNKFMTKSKNRRRKLSIVNYALKEIFCQNKERRIKFLCCVVIAQVYIARTELWLW